MSVEVRIRLPGVAARRLRDLGVDVESMILDLIIREIKLDPREEAEARVELATWFLEEGRSLIDKNPVQASEKLYKAAEECVKALATHFKLEDILEKVRERGRWTVRELARAVEAISDKVGDWFVQCWDSAWALHVWGFHEAKLDSEAVKRRLPCIERIVEETKKVKQR